MNVSSPGSLNEIDAVLNFDFCAVDDNFSHGTESDADSGARWEGRGENTKTGRTRQRRDEGRGMRDEG